MESEQYGARALRTGYVMLRSSSETAQFITQLKEQSIKWYKQIEICIIRKLYECREFTP